MRKLVLKIRNVMEMSRLGQVILNRLTSNIFYRKYIYGLVNKKATIIYQQRRYSFAIEVTTFCNAKCTFCPNSKMKRIKNTMGQEMVLKIIKRIKEEKIVPIRFNLTGTGEPLMDKNLFEKIDLLKTNFPEAEVYFPTNLALANEEVVNKILDSKLDSITVSLNADNARDYKKIMNLDYATTVNNLNNLISQRRIKNSRLKIHLSLAANPDNKDTVENMVKKWDKKVEAVTVNWIHTWAGAMDKVKSIEQSAPHYPCRPIFEQIIIHSDGNIPLCLVDYEGKYVGGNVMKNKILDSYYAPNIEKIRQMHRDGKVSNMAMCSQCRFSERGMYWLID
jgi:radical SAM protein with 4Fe4S-binding SPASM domain